MAQVEADTQSLVSMLRQTAESLIAEGAFMPLGASISQRGEFVVEYVPPAASSLETRKALHRKLVEIAKSGQARAVAICHSLAAQTGAFLIVSVDHAQAEPVTFLFPIQSEGGREHIATEPIVQQAAYTFFGFVDVSTAQRLLLGTWVKDSGQEAGRDTITYHPNNVFQRAGQTGFWAVDEGDFYTNLIEFLQGASTPQRVARIINITPERVVLHEVSAGVVTASAYRRSG